METKAPTDPSIAPKKAKKRTSRRISEVDLAKLKKRLLNVLTRETNYLLDQSHAGKLERDDSASLRDYLKLMKDLTALDEKDAAALTTEQLAKLAGEE